MDSIETAKMAAIVRSIMEQMNSSKPDKDTEDYIVNPLPSSITFAKGVDIRGDSLKVRGLRPECYVEICPKLLLALNLNPDVMLHSLLNEYNNLQSLVAGPNMIESNGTRTCLIKKPKLDRSTEKKPMPRPKTHQAYPNNRVQFVRTQEGIPPEQVTATLPMLQEKPLSGSTSPSAWRTNHDASNLDTGSDITIVSNEAWKALGCPKIDTVHFKVPSVSGDAVQLSREMKCEATFKGKTAVTVHYVVNRGIKVGLD
ncbi:unnamed protein product [Hymenolepis diminuta]|uniref:Peptidase A2 domain-containing protein n=1 Tax=Hymenolepis diminuta TaxID=6216 RepID=A0A564Z326_HYMDI|nr:unnamed protein product [Hymenolepis diminuta]